MELLKRKSWDLGGQALVEYAFILMLIALVSIGALTFLGIPIKGFYTAFNGSF